MKPMRIIFFRNARGIVDVTGAESYIFALMQALDPSGASSLLLAATHPDLPDPPWLREVRRRGLPHEVVSVGSKFGMDDLFTLRKSMRSFGADVVHSTDHRGDILGLLAARAGDKAHVASFFGWTNFQTTTFKGRIYPWLDRIAQQSSDALITDSAYTARVSGLLETGKAPVAVIHNGIDPQRFDPQSLTPEFRGRWFGRSDLLVFGMLGRVHPNKGQLDFVEMAASLRVRFPNARFVVLGAAPRGYEGYAAQLREAVVHHGMQDCFLVDNVASADVPRALRSLDVLVAPSYVESFSFSLLEAMCMGLPVLATDVGGNREMMVDSRSGLIVPAGDAASLLAAAEALAGDSVLRARLGVCARERALERFTVRTMADRTLEVYRQILDWRSGKRRDRAVLGARLVGLGNGGVAS